MKITNTAYINVEVRVMLQRIICFGVLFRLDKWKLLIRARYVNFTLYQNVVAIEREFFCGAHLMTERAGYKSFSLTFQVLWRVLDFSDEKSNVLKMNGWGGDHGKLSKDLHFAALLG